MTPTSGSGGTSGGQKPSSGASSGTNAAQKSADAQKKAQEEKNEAAKAGSNVQVDPTKQAVALRNAGVQPGQGTAAGHAAAGSPDAIDTAAKEGPIPAEEAEIGHAVVSPSGTIPANMVGSPSGPVPVGAFADTASAQRAADVAAVNIHSHHTRGARGHRKLDEATLRRMSRAEVRAVATDRGYDIPEGGRKVSVAKFLKLQDEDDLAYDEEEGSEAETRTPEITGVTTGGGPAAASGGGATGVNPGGSAEAERVVNEATKGGATGADAVTLKDGGKES